MENPIKMDDLGVPSFLETPIYIQIWMFTLSCISRSAARCSKFIVCFNLDNYIVLSVSLHVHVYIYIFVFFDTISYIYILE